MRCQTDLRSRSEALVQSTAAAVHCRVQGSSAAFPMLLSMALATLLLASVGCTARNNPEQAVMRVGDGMTDLFSGNRHAKAETIRIEASVPISVDVDTFNGDVTVRGNPNARRATIVVRRESKHGVLRSREGKESLEMVEVSAELVPGDLGPSLRVRATSTGVETHFQAAHITIEVPEIDDVRIRTGVGAVDVRHVAGRVDIEARRGKVLFATPAPITQSVTMVTNDGDVDFRAGRGSTGDFDMESVGGRVLQRATEGRWIATDANNRYNRVRARLNDGRNPVILRATDGHVRVAVNDDPMAFGLLIIDP